MGFCFILTVRENKTHIYKLVKTRSNLSYGYCWVGGSIGRALLLEKDVLLLLSAVRLSPFNPTIFWPQITCACVREKEVESVCVCVCVCV